MARPLDVVWPAAIVTLVPARLVSARYGHMEQVALLRVDPLQVDAPTVDGGQGQDGRGQEEGAGDVEREVETVSEGTVGGRDHLVDDVGDGGVLGRGRLGLALVRCRW